MASPSAVRAGQAYIELGTEDRYLAGLRKAEARLRRFGTAVTAVGAAMVKAATVALVPLGAGLKVYAGFEEQMNMVSTMLDKPEQWMKRFRRSIREMSVEYGMGTDTLAKGLYDLLSAGVSAEDAISTLAVATRGAIGGQTDTATSVKAVVRILRAFNLESAAAKDVSDILFQVVKQGVITYEELAETIGTVAPTAKAAGMTLEQLAASIATVVSVEEPARGMTALRQALYEAAEAGVPFLNFVKRFKNAKLEDVIKAGIPKKSAQAIVILGNNLALLERNLAGQAKRAGASDAATAKWRPAWATWAGRPSNRAC